jgi:hypothetical protein
VPAGAWLPGYCCVCLLLVNLQLPAQKCLQSCGLLLQLMPAAVLRLYLQCWQLELVPLLLPGALLRVLHHPYHQPPVQPIAWPCSLPQLRRLNLLPALCCCACWRFQLCCCCQSQSESRWTAQCRRYWQLRWCCCRGWGHPQGAAAALAAVSCR